jgi:hypothetical protein
MIPKAKTTYTKLYDKPTTSKGCDLMAKLEENK